VCFVYTFAEVGVNAFGAFMKTFAFLFLLLSQSSLAVAPNQTALEGAWLQVDSKWINAPKEVAPHEQWSQTAENAAPFRIQANDFTVKNSVLHLKHGKVVTQTLKTFV
jgi:hypothetical protein